MAAEGAASEILPDDVAARHVEHMPRPRPASALPECFL